MTRNKTGLLCKTCLNEQSKEDDKIMEDWCSENPDNRRLRDILKRIKLSSQVSEYAESARENIRQQLNKKIDRSRRLLIFKIGAAAAVVLFVIGLSNYVAYQEGYKKRNCQLVTLENPLGIRSSVVLPDGSKVTLNAGSVLTYPTAFVSAERKVTIEGEAYFEITRDTKHPFLVQAENLQVKVLGTVFNVKAYKEEDCIEVTLVEGAVAVGLERESQYIQLNPRQLARFNKTDRTFCKQQVNLNNYTAWKDGRFYFDRLTFRNIATQLERNFNVDIHIDSEKLKSTVFSGDFIRGENLEQILRIMTADKRIHYKIEGDQVYIREK